MPSLKMLPEDEQITINPDENILLASLSAGIPHVHACGGKGRCSTCRVIVLDGMQNCVQPNEKEAKLAQKMGFTSNIRLACQTQVSGDLTVRRVVLDDVDLEIITNSLKNGIQSIGEEKEVSILFSDIANYTTFTDAAQPYDTVHFLNRYFREMGEIVAAKNGRIIDYYGDGFLAIFGLEGDLYHSDNTVAAGCKMLDKAKSLSAYYKQISGCIFQLRLGINTGNVIVGNIGIDKMRKFAAIGGEVNFASRIEAANKELGTQFLISQSTFEHLNEKVKIKATHIISVKGKLGQHKVYEPSHPEIK